MEERKEPEELIIVSCALRGFEILISHGKDSKEWIVALGGQEIDRKLVMTMVYDINCTISHSTVLRSIIQALTGF